MNEPMNRDAINYAVEQEAKRAVAKLTRAELRSLKDQIIDEVLERVGPGGNGIRYFGGSLYINRGTANQVDFLQLGSGALPRTMGDYAQDVLHLADFVLGNGNDESSGLANAFAEAALTGRKLYGNGLNITFSTPQSFDYGKAAFDGEGCTFTFTGATTTPAITLVTTSQTLVYNAQRFGFSGFRLTGSDGSSGTQVGLKCAGVIASSTYAAEPVIDRYVIDSFGTGITWGDNSWAQSFGSGQIHDCGWAIDYPSGLTNSGERISFGYTNVFNSLNGIRANGGMFHFLSLSVDFITNRFMHALNGGQIHATHFHIEGNSDNDYWIVAQDANSCINLSSGRIFLGVAKTAFAVGQSSNTGACQINLSNFSIEVGNVSFLTGYGFAYLINGHGTARNFSWVNGGNPAIVIFSQGNSLVDGGFESSTIRDFCATATSGGAPTLSSAQKHAGSQSLLLQPSISGSTAVTYFGNCSPGDQIVISWWMLTASVVTDVIYFELDFYDANGAIVATNGSSRTFSAANSNLPTSWTLEYLLPGGQAPLGTSFFKLLIQKGGGAFGLTASEGPPSACYLDDMYIEVTGRGGNQKPMRPLKLLKTITIDDQITIPSGYALDSIYAINTTANAITGGLDIGTNYGSDIASAITVAGNAEIFVDAASMSTRFFSSTLAQTITFHAHTSWNSASLNVVLTAKRAT